MAIDRTVSFTVAYEDGSTTKIVIEKAYLTRGDYIARIIASERQGKGEIPSGIIKSVERLKT
jgi:hypothetical protein